MVYTMVYIMVYGMVYMGGIYLGIKDMVYTIHSVLYTICYAGHTTVYIIGIYHGILNDIYIHIYHGIYHNVRDVRVRTDKRSRQD
jgi:hypothetical protein